MIMGVRELFDDINYNLEDKAQDRVQHLMCISDERAKALKDNKVDVDSGDEQAEQTTKDDGGMFRM